jgi:hypothetical protein
MSTNVSKEYSKSMFKVDEDGDSMVLGKVGVVYQTCVVMTLKPQYES